MQEIFEQIGQSITAFFQTIRLGSVNQLILCFAIGAILASIASYYHKNYIGRLVRFLLRENASDLQSAKTLKDMGLQNNRLFRFALRKKSTLRRIITVTDAAAADSLTEPSSAETAAQPRIQNTEEQRKVPVSETSAAVNLKQKEDLTNCLLFIAPGKATEHAIRAYSKPGNGGKAIVLTVLLVTVTAGLCIGFLPDILALVSSTVGQF